MEVIIKDDVEVSKKGKITMDVKDMGIWEVILHFSLSIILTETLQKMKHLCQDLQITRLVGKEIIPIRCCLNSTDHFRMYSFSIDTLFLLY